MARDQGTTDAATPTEHPLDSGELLNGWLAQLDPVDTAEAHACLMTGRYSHRLLVSLRSVLPTDARVRHGLDDPNEAQVGDPLSATIQTALRDHLLTDGLPDTRSARWGD